MHGRGILGGQSVRNQTILLSMKYTPKKIRYRRRFIVTIVAMVLVLTLQIFQVRFNLAEQWMKGYTLGTASTLIVLLLLCWYHIRNDMLQAERDYYQREFFREQEEQRAVRELDKHPSDEEDTYGTNHSNT